MPAPETSSFMMTTFVLPGGTKMPTSQPVASIVLPDMTWWLCAVINVVRPVVPAAEQDDDVAKAGCTATGIIESPRRRTIANRRVLGLAVCSSNNFLIAKSGGFQVDLTLTVSDD